MFLFYDRELKYKKFHLEKELLCIEGDRAVEQTAQDEGVSLSEKSTWICSCVTYFR